MQRKTPARAARVACAALLAWLPVCAALADEPRFVDPTATLVNRSNIRLGPLTYVAPFAALKAGRSSAQSIEVGGESNVQDNVTVDANRGRVKLGEMAILAHGATVKGPARLGETGTCPGGAAHCPSFVGFNSEIDGATLQKDAMVTHLARVAPGLTVPSGCKVMPGKLITSQAEMGTAPACNPPNTTPVTEADRAFMHGVIEVNLCFARQYAAMRERNSNHVRGINFDPNCPFNPGHQLPRFAGKTVRDPSYRNRIIGDVRIGQELDDVDENLGAQISLRADEGAPFEIGSIREMKSRVVFHALEHTHIDVGRRGTYGYRALVHGGPANNATTSAGDALTLGKEAVFFQSTAGDNVKVGCRSFVQASQLPAGTQIPDRTVVIGNAFAGRVEWGACSPDPADGGQR